ncbi:MAG: HAD family hydrolase [Selenomonadaceae bacterium]|nr:HAD family hydrolase [Selenomonadaceae bacterium]
MRVKLFLLLDFLFSVVMASYVYFTNEVDVAITTGLSVFISFSPIGLILASPFVLHMARGVLEKDNIKVNRAQALKNLSEVDTVAVPLNRFLMDGDYFVTDLVPVGLSQQALLGVAATAEQKSSHLLGRVIYRTAAGRGLKIQNIAASREYAGLGVETISNGSTIRVGSPTWVERQGVSVSNALLTKIDKLSVYGKTVLLLGIGRMARGIIALKDEINFDAKEFLMLLKRKKMITVMMTAASKKTAKSLAKNFNLDAIKTNLTPNDKAREVKILQTQGHSVAFVSNETNDIPAMVAADVSVLLQQKVLSPFAVDDDARDEREENTLAELKAELEKIPLVDADDEEKNSVNEKKSAEENKSFDEEKISDYTNVKPDIEIPTLSHFLMARDFSLRIAELIKTNRNITYFSWIVFVPMATLNALQNPPFKFDPIMALGGVALCALLIFLNSLRIRSSSR